MDERLKKIKCFLLDMDGTIYLENEVFEGAREAVERMRAQARVLFLTNNCSSSRDDYLRKLNRLGFNAKKEEIFTAGNATVEFLTRNYKDKRVFLFGTPSLFDEFHDAGINTVEENPDLVVLSFDIFFDYPRLEKLCRFIREGVPYIATHPDINCPTAYGYKPDVGSFIALVEKSTGVSPLLVCGKPNRPIGESIERLLGLRSEQIAMFGDRLATDIRFAINNKFLSCFVLSGEGTIDEAKKTGIYDDIDIILPSIAHWDN